MGVTLCTRAPGLLASCRMNTQIFTLTLVALVSASPLSRVRRQSANEVATRIVAVSESKPELLSTAVSQADPDLLRVALTDANPDLLEVALTKAKAELLGTALTRGVRGELLRVALTQSREDTLATALPAADPTLLPAALTESSPELLGTDLTDADVRLLGTALTRGVARELLVTALTRSRSDTLST